MSKYFVLQIKDAPSDSCFGFVTRFYLQKFIMKNFGLY